MKHRYQDQNHIYVKIVKDAHPKNGVYIHVLLYTIYLQQSFDYMI